LRQPDVSDLPPMIARLWAVPNRKRGNTGLHMYNEDHLWGPAPKGSINKVDFQT
jgi:hypothetical protein